MELHQPITLIWRDGNDEQEEINAVFTSLHKKNDKVKCENYQGISLVSRVGKMLLKVAARRLSGYCEAKGLLPKEYCEF